MILPISDDVTSIAVRVKSWRNQRYVESWQDLRLCIFPGQRDHDCCCSCGGSPWILHGCWPHHRTGIDLMNPPPPDFPAFFIKPKEKLEDHQVVFDLPDRWKNSVPHGRYSAEVRYQPDVFVAVNMLPRAPRVGRGPDDPESWEFLDPGACLPKPPPPPCPCPPPKPGPRPCILAVFDIDYGPRCSQHIIDKASIDF